ncbi:hypothetical protein QR98_0011120 [Sarcoptes scabiei]|uniref:Uncharacterized protein n=1 Tax=Sarcoptes scabiei TaxID=52283 RepID=A0A131ZVA7_SARSC|nr:hypothetical protein QR98_0011120 [Sarcoptes scabiei]
MPKVNRKLGNINLILPSNDTPPRLSTPPSELKRSTKIRINGVTIDIDPENTKSIKQLGHGAYVTDQDRLFRDMDVLVKSRGCPYIVCVNNY